jgi:hypothetical protein
MIKRWTPKPDSVTCEYGAVKDADGRYIKTGPRPKCGGTLWDVTSRLAAQFGFIHLECDRCKRRWAVRVRPAPNPFSAERV